MEIDYSLILRILAVAACLAGAVGILSVTLWGDE